LETCKTGTATTEKTSGRGKAAMTAEQKSWFASYQKKSEQCENIIDLVTKKRCTRKTHFYVIGCQVVSGQPSQSKRHYLCYRHLKEYQKLTKNVIEYLERKP
jgi:hypothetical protein